VELVVCVCVWSNALVNTKSVWELGKVEVGDRCHRGSTRVQCVLPVCTTRDREGARAPGHALVTTSLCTCWRMRGLPRVRWGRRRRRRWTCAEAQRWTPAGGGASVCVSLLWRLPCRCRTTRH
jgi:hypothetical protein